MDSTRKSLKSSSPQKCNSSSQSTSFESALEQPILQDEFLVKIDSTSSPKPPRVPIDVTNPFNQNNSFNRQYRIHPEPPSIPIHSTKSPRNVDEEKLETKEIAIESQYGTIGSMQRGTSTLLRRKTRSRLTDPQPLPVGAVTSGIERKSSQLPSQSSRFKSGVLGKSGPGEDDEDESLDEEIPHEFKRPKFNVLTILQLISLIIILAALVGTFTVLDLRKRIVLGLELWKWELLGFVFICGRLVSGWVVRIVVFFIERNFMLRKNVLYFVYGLRVAVQNSIWLGLVLLTWHLLLDDNLVGNLKTLQYVTKVLLCLLIAALFHLGKTLLVKLLASSFHYSTYFERIQEALFHQYVIETLSGPPVIEIQIAKNEEEQLITEVHKYQSMGYQVPKELRAAALSGGKFQNDSSKKKEEVSARGTMSSEQLYKMSQQNISAWSMKRLIRTVRYGTLTTLDEQIPSDAEDESTAQIRSEHEAKAAAKKIFVNVAKPGEKYIYLSDLLRFMKREEAVKTMYLFEGAEEKNRICKKSLKIWVVEAFRERKALALTLNDTKTAVNKLSHMGDVIVFIIVLSVSLLILGIATTRFFVVLGSQLLLAGFMFGNTVKTVFEAIIFLFVMHPYDVGDRCEVDGVQLIVEEMNIMTTIFLRPDNLRISYPNSVLSLKPISNYYRSPDMGDAIDFSIHVATPVEKLAMMKEKIIKFIENKKELWYPNPRVVLRDVDDTNRLKVTIWLRHRMNFQNMAVRFERREAVVAEMIRALRELDIEYRMLPVDVNLRNMPTVTSTRVPSTWSIFN
ncbi:Mechanosensitive ion channel family protein [Rhynchospora pubera]|uniref:Mechanosensitive ion channel protein n=1 Tax=Rhynchospora pubera TaxID=906938 RepID=A0AAV8F238_9POAL|nr:Mechanosensitive ion channel family protein [Rhynchospora pubera]